jgi:hypothetical protein
LNDPQQTRHHACLFGVDDAAQVSLVALCGVAAMQDHASFAHRTSTAAGVVITVVIAGVSLYLLGSWAASAYDKRQRARLGLGLSLTGSGKVDRAGYDPTDSALLAAGSLSPLTGSSSSILAEDGGGDSKAFAMSRRDRDRAALRDPLLDVSGDS